MGGIPTNNRHTIDDKYKCVVCKLVLRQPVQLTACGHRLCHSCIATHQSSITCVMCGAETPADQTLTDRGLGHELQLLSVNCALCNWAGVLREYEHHLHNDHASATFQYDIHVTRECPLRDWGCREPMTDENKQQHYLSSQHQHAIIDAVQRQTTDEAGAHVDTDLLSSDTTVPAISEWYDILSVLTNGVRTLNEDTLRLSDESTQAHVHLHTLTDRATEVRLSVEQSRSFVNAVKHNADTLAQDVASLADKVDDAQHVSRDGTFVWKIAGVQEKTQDARSERRTSIYSPPFYSSPTGYKMRLRLYLHGDGNARRTHMSLFFVLMRGEHDAVLQFPFAHKVTFCLYDQSGGGRHIIDSFRPDVRSNSFQRPRSTMNIASGIPKFCSLQVVEEENSVYVRNDTMFIRVMVDFSDVPKVVLPYAMSLNPGIPTSIQQAMVKREAERPSQQ